MRIIRLGKDLINEEEPKFVGFYLSKKMYEDLILLSVSRESSKSAILKKQLKDILDSLDLITQIAERLLQLFQMRNQPWSNLSPKMFFTYCRKDLIKRGVQDYTLQEIFKKFDVLVKKKKLKRKK